MTEIPNIGLYRRVTALALVVAPAILVVGNLLHPKEYERDREAEQLAKIGEAYTRWQAVHFGFFVAVVLFAAAVLGLAFLVRRRSPTLGLAAGALGLAGLIALSGVDALDGVTWGILGEVHARPGADQETVALVLHDVQQSEWTLPFYLGTLGFVIGIVTLGVTAARDGALPAWAGWLLALGGLMTGIEAFVPSNAYYVAASVVLLAGGAATAAALLRMDDREFAAGGPGR
jgi:hypothetical protein